MIKKKLIYSFYLDILLLLSYLNDYLSFRNHSIGYSKKINFHKMNAIITLNNHSIEKGLSHSNFRFGFGRDLIIDTMSTMKKFTARFPDFKISPSFLSVLSSLKVYYEIHKNNDSFKNSNFQYLETIRYFLDEYGQVDVSSEHGGVKTLNKIKILEHSKSDFSNLTLNRYSVRDYSNEVISSESIYQAISIALRTPSVCNRQGWKPIVINDPELISDLLLLQGGFKGFGKNIQYLILITSSYNHFLSYTERNQCFIDGGSFSMSLIYALTSLGIANCPLNANMHPKNIKKVKDILKLDKSDVLIMFISVGSYPNEITLPKAIRYSLSDILELDKKELA